MAVGAHSDWTFEHLSAHPWESLIESHPGLSAEAAAHTTANASVASVLTTLWHHEDLMGGASNATSAHALAKDILPLLTVGEDALTVNAGGSVVLPIKVDHASSVTIAGLTSYESVTDNLDHKTFTGSSITLTAAEVNSGLSLASNYTGTGHPVNDLSVTASETIGHATLTSAAQIIKVTDPPTTTGSSGGASNGLTLQVSGDMLNGTDPQIQVFVDGQQLGGTYTISAHHSQGQTETLALGGNFDPTVAHQVQVKFINDAWDGQSGDGHDVNVYVESIALNGQTIAGAQGTNTASNGGIKPANANEAVMDINGTLTVSVPADPPTTTAASTGGSSGTTSNALTLQVSGDMLNTTDPQIQVFVDGKQVGGTFDVTAHHSQGQTETLQIPGSFDPTVAHQVQVKFLNDAWDGQSGDGHDVNVYVQSISLNGQTLNGSQGANTASNGAIQGNANEAVMDIDGTLTFSVAAAATASAPAPAPAASTAGSGSSSGGGTTGGSTSSSGNPLTLVVTGDNLQGTDPQIEVFVDGTQVGGTFTVTADHSQGQTQTLQVGGNFDPTVAHQIQVKFINDAWDGQVGDGHDINVYVESISLNGTSIAGAQGTNNASNGGIKPANANEAVMDINGTLTFSVPASSTSGSGSSGGSTSASTASGSGSSGSGVLPQHIVGEWWWSFNPPTIATVQKDAPQVNYLSLVGAFANGNGGGNVNDGDLFNDYSSVQALQSDINAWKASGRVVVGMIGGGGDTTVINNATDAANFIASAEPIIRQLGLQGVDFDLENTPNASAVASIITQLKADFGPDFIISMSPRPFELRSGGVYRQVIQDAGINNIDLIQPQDYALNGDSLSAQQSYMNADMADWIGGKSGLTIPANKLLIGSFDPNEGESLSTAMQTFNFYKGVYPTLRGGMMWSTQGDQSELGWQFAAQLSQAEQ
jgi:hypothetical protein